MADAARRHHGAHENIQRGFGENNEGVHCGWAGDTCWLITENVGGTCRRRCTGGVGAGNGNRLESSWSRRVRNRTTRTYKKRTRDDDCDGDDDGDNDDGDNDDNDNDENETDNTITTTRNTLDDGRAQTDWSRTRATADPGRSCKDSSTIVVGGGGGANYR